MADTKDSDLRTPAYSPYQTFSNFLLDHRKGVPARLDANAFPHMGGGMKRRLVATLRYLDLSDDQANSLPALDHLVRLEGAEREKALRDLILKKYSWVLSPENGYDFGKNATLSQVKERFEAQGATGETRRKAIAFFLNACSDAKIPTSPFIKQSHRPSPPGRTSRTGTARQAKASKRSAAKSKDKGERPPTPPDPEVPRHEKQVPTLEQVLADKLLAKFPAYDADAPDELKTRWFDQFAELRSMVQKITESSGNKNGEA